MQTLAVIGRRQRAKLRAISDTIRGMAWKPDAAYLAGIDFFDDVVRSAGASDWHRASPCEGWTAVDVLGHVGVAVDFGTRMLRGEQPAWSPVDPPGRAVSGDPAQWWRGMVEPARDAVRSVDLTTELDSPMGRRSVGDGLGFPAVDLFVHGWDLARSFDRDAVIPDEAIDFARAMLGRFPSEQLRSPRVFAGEVDVPSGMSASQRFIAWTGRDPR